jgi:hypothetical protein
MKEFALAGVLVMAFGLASRAHELENTRVTITFAEDGTFLLDIANDPNWLLLRLESFNRSIAPAGMTAEARDARIAALAPVLIDRVVLWVDGREIRPQSAQYLPLESTFRLRGQMPLDARTLRWLYGSVGDPYPLIVRRADGRTLTEIVEGSNWSGTLNLAGQFKSSRLAGVDHIALLVGLFAAAVAIRAVTSVRRRAPAARIQMGVNSEKS